MKHKNLKVLMLLIASILFAGGMQLQAQKKGNNCPNKEFGKRGGVECKIPDLTEEQQKKIDKLKVDHRKAMLQNRNIMAEKKARLNTLRTADKPDMASIDKTVEEMGALRTKMMKEKEAHIQKVRALLTDEQKVHFDTHAHKRKGGNCMGAGQMGRRGHRFNN